MQALKALEDNAEPSPEMRILSISNDGKVFLSFNNDMHFPTNFTDILNFRVSKKDLNVTKSAKNAKSFDKKVGSQQLVNGAEFLFFEIISYDTESVSPYLDSWNVTDVNPRLITV